MTSATKAGRGGVLFLAECGAGIGYGHLMRSKALMGHLASQGIPACMLLDVKEWRYEPSDLRVKVADWIRHPDAVRALAGTYDIVFVDSYLAAPDYYRFLRSIFRKTVAMDDYNRIRYDADLVLNHNIFGSEMDYRSQTAEVAGGREYTLLRDAILRKGQGFRPAGEVRRVLVTLGGSDYRHLMPAIVAALDRSGCAIDAIAGTDGYRQELEAGCHSKTAVFHGFLDDERMAGLMSVADVAVSAAGSTMNELAYLGVPTIAVCIDTDQMPVIEAYHRYGFIRSMLYWDDRDLGQKIVRDLEELRPQGVRLAMSLAGKKLIDGNGVKNACRKIVERGWCS